MCITLRISFVLIEKKIYLVFYVPVAIELLFSENGLHNIFLNKYLIMFHNKTHN